MMLTAARCRALSNHLYRAERRTYDAACSVEDDREAHLRVALAHLREAAAICGLEIVVAAERVAPA